MGNSMKLEKEQRQWRGCWLDFVFLDEGMMFPD